MAKKKGLQRPRRPNRSRAARWRTPLTWLAFLGLALALIYVVFFVGRGEVGSTRAGGSVAPPDEIPEPISEVAGPPADVVNRPLLAEATAEGRTNILLLGVDQRAAGAGQAARSDTIMVATVDRRSQTAGVLSIPRDLYVSIPQCQDGAGSVLEHKINTANFWGDYWGCPGGGPALAAKTIQLNFGIPIDYYVSVDFKCFERAIDAIGGITVNVERDLVDNRYPDDEHEGQAITVHFAAGPQRLDGRRALQYARMRNPDSDFGRIHRQQQVVMAVRQKLLEPATWPKLPSVIQTLYGSVRTDMPLHEIIALINVARGIDTDDIILRTIDNTMVKATTLSSGTEVLIPNWGVIDLILKELFATSGG